jgi:hypothetical protein
MGELSVIFEQAEGTAELRHNLASFELMGEFDFDFDYKR